MRSYVVIATSLSTQHSVAVGRFASFVHGTNRHCNLRRSELSAFKCLITALGVTCSIAEGGRGRGIFNRGSSERELLLFCIALGIIEAFTGGGANSCLRYNSGAEKHLSPALAQ